MAIQNASTEPKKSPGVYITIISTGLLVGTLDGLGATINYLISGRKDPGKLFQYISSGAFGKDAYSGGLPMVFSGILFHYTIAFLFTIFFYMVLPRIKWLSKNKLAGGMLYGIFIWLVMTFLVLPLTRIPRGVIHLKPALIGISILIIAIGIPLSYIANAYYSRYPAV